LTSAQLKAELAGHHTLGKQKSDFSPEDVYFAARHCQQQILSILKPLDRTSQLSLVSGQEEYTFAAQTVTAGTATTPATLTIADHPFNTGDDILVDAVAGLTGVNGFRRVTKVSANVISLDNTVGAGAWTSGGVVYHALHGALQVKTIRKISDASGTLYGTIDKKLKVEIEKNREDFAIQAPTDIINFWEEYTDPITIGFQGVPASATLVSVSYYRKAIEGAEDISASVNPIVPDRFRWLLMFGTRYFMYQTKFEDGIEKAQEKALKIYTENMNLALKSMGASRRVANDDVSGMRFK